MTALVEKMRAARDGASVILMRYNQRRSSHAGKIFIAVEGTEDISFYETMIKRVVGEHNLPEHYYFVCDGKDNVLDLVESLKSNLSADSENVVFFIDHDFDGRKGKQNHPRLYVTETYSIENQLASRSVFEALLDAEFRCSVDDHDADRDAALAVYDDFVNRYATRFKMVNRCIFISRKCKGIIVNTQSSIEEKAKIRAHSLSFEAETLSGSIHLLEIELSDQDMEKIFDDNPKVTKEFDELDPVSQWRGKYIYHAFVKLLKVLVEDRGRRKGREVFPNRAAIQFEPHEGAVRLFASVAPVPVSLRNFLLSGPLNCR
ncbi:DUF4435 domain-containing protein [Agrobacterium vaccinii]|uniref:DUF4435 domain-containing protein n=1 Tax=Agrobacterium vaccinii TaxID=2735528 RepID=UPI001E4517FE|nr:DUF4435 domain-containing protein [Agrobacterium vaccinii]UHS55591.1 DUF4435 domain-containing protein [Agrobacterium vaccinii]